MKRALRILTALLPLFCTTAVLALNAGTDSEVELTVPPSSESFTVAILADRTTGYGSGLAVLDRAVTELNLLEPELVFHIGDMVPGYIRDMDRWERDVQKVKDILDRLEAPFFPTAGNHDVITGTGSPDDHRGEELYLRHFGPLYYSLDYRGAHFVVLYTDEALQSHPEISQEQIEWLRRDLADADADQVFVLLHKPVWEYPENNWDQVHRILRQHSVRAVIAGHFHHYYRSHKRDGIQYYVIGVTGGRTFSPELAGGLEHYCLLRVSPRRYSLALVKPGHILPDDYIVAKDYKEMEQLRRLSREQTGVDNALPSPEAGPVNATVSIRAANPLDRPLPLTVRGLGPGHRWRFRPSVVRLTVPPHQSRRVELTVAGAEASARELSVPEVEIVYHYVDSRGRTVPLVLPRRIPLRRELTTDLRQASISLDGAAEEQAWTSAPLLTTAHWQTSPYESDEPGPTFRTLATPAGLYLFVTSPDQHVSRFRAPRMLSDALFVGGISGESGYGAAVEKPPIIVIYPFDSGRSRAVRAFWDARRPVGPAVEGVFAESKVLPGGKGWRCEALVPWNLLLAGETEPPKEMLFNLGVWDNDGDLFTELHSWAPTDTANHWGRLLVGDPAEE